MNLYEHWQHTPPTSFRQGVELLLQHCPGAVTRRILDALQTCAFGSKTPDTYLQGKLKAALSSTTYTARETTTESPAFITITTGAQQGEPVIVTVGPQQEAPALTSEHAKFLHKKHAYHHARMAAAETDELRAEYAREIMVGIIPSLDAEYDRLRAGGSAEPPAAEKTATAETANSIFQRLHSLRTRVSKIRNKLLPTATGDRLQQLQDELAEKLAEIETLENRPK